MATNWREAWYPHRQNSGGVQVWARIATSPKHSLAVKWLHQLGNQPQDLKETSLGGGMGETGRIWHRMYPQYSINQQGDLKNTKQYVENLIHSSIFQ
jgi:CRISPR-associated protein Cmr6